jgi:uncharacterized Zn finger protein (UPF0148 family)
MNIREEAKIMADLLRSGHTMLSDSCPVCNNPVFQSKQGHTFCPICNREIIFLKGDQEVSDNVKKSLPHESHTPNNIQSYESKAVPVKEHMFEIVTKKINWILQKLKNETQIEMVERYTKLLLTLSELLKLNENLE